MKAAAQVREPAEVALVNRIKQLRRDTVLVCTEEDGFILRVTIEDLVRHYVLHLPDAQKQKLLTQLGKCEMAEILMSSPMYCGKKYTEPYKCACGACDGHCGPKTGCQCKECAESGNWLEMPNDKDTSTAAETDKKDVGAQPPAEIKIYLD